MFWLLSRLVVWPVKAVTGTAKVTTKAGAKATAGSFKAGYRTGRVIGLRRVVLLGAGVGVGLLVAPKPGRELREQLRSRLEEQGLLQPAGAAGAGAGGGPFGGTESPSALPDVAAASAASGNGTTTAPPVGASPAEAEGEVAVAAPLDVSPQSPAADPLA